MSLKMETLNPNVLILYSLGCMVGSMLTSVLALSAIIYKNGRLLNLLNGSRKWKTNSNNFHRRNAKKKKLHYARD
nr:MAG: hypothetical protein [Hemigrapsus takanoi nimavirus]